MKNNVSFIYYVRIYGLVSKNTYRSKILIISTL